MNFKLEGKDGRNKRRRLDFVCEMFHVSSLFSFYSVFITSDSISWVSFFLISPCFCFFLFFSGINSFCKSRKIYCKDGCPWRRSWPPNWPPWPFNVSQFPLFAILFIFTIDNQRGEMTECEPFKSTFTYFGQNTHHVFTHCAEHSLETRPTRISRTLAAGCVMECFIRSKPKKKILLISPPPQQLVYKIWMTPDRHSQSL